MSTHMTKTWFDGEKIVTQEISVEKIYWQGLTDEERSELWWNTDMSDMPEHDYGKAIENKLKEKNT